MVRGPWEHVYFESVVTIIALILLGNLLEARAKSRTSQAVRKLARLRPATARVVRANEERDIPLGELLVGDEAIVRPEKRFPVTAWSSTAAATWTNPCSPVSPSR